MTTATKTFSQLGVVSKSLSGDKISITEILDKQITVLAYRIEDSRYGKKNDDAKCLYLQIQWEGQTRVIFSGSNVLMQDIQSVAKTDFPFTTTIIKVPINDKDFFLKFT